MNRTRVLCTACNSLPENRPYCHECGGLGYIECVTRVPNCNRRCATDDPPGPCPLEYEIMVDGWMCTFCGDSGPL